MADRAKKGRKIKHSGDKVVASCLCGKKYRVPEKRAGKPFSCRLCGRDVHVGKTASVSMRSRNAILAELGVDPEAAEEQYVSERAHSTRMRREQITRTKAPRYRCTECREPIEDPKTAYDAGLGLICQACKADEVVHRDQAYDPTDRQVPGRLKEWVGAEPQSEGMSAGKALGYFVLFLLGFTGLARFLFEGVFLTWILPSLVAAGVSYMIYSQMKASSR